MEELAILDVAHGNSALLLSGACAAIFDAAPRPILLESIEYYGVRVIDHIFVSHSDYDHMGGVANILLSPDVEVRNLHINPDSTKKGKWWHFLRVAVDDAVARYQLRVWGLHSGGPSIAIGHAQVSILAPSPGNALSGTGGVSTAGRVINSNSASAVLMLQHLNHNIALFAGDMEQQNLTALVNKQCNLQADVLIFPHHGGLVSGNIQTFATQLTQQVNPKLTIFSIGRAGYSNLRPAVVTAVRAAAPTTHIMCTQLSQNCFQPDPPFSFDWIKHIGDIPGMGTENNSSCSGSIRIELAGPNSIFHLVNEHQDFVTANIPARLCV